MKIDRASMSAALAKAIAHKAAGNDALADTYARSLVRLLNEADISTNDRDTGRAKEQQQALEGF
jgi:hypothetical protein